MKYRKLAAMIFSLVLVASTGAVAVADTIRLRDGSVIRGQIIGYKDQQFTVLIGGARGRRSRITIYSEDVESIEFDNAAAANAGTQPADDSNNNSAANDTGNGSQSFPADTRPAPTPVPRNTSPQPVDTGASRNTGTASPVFFPIRLRVRADNAANGWTDSGLMVRKGQRLRITAQGRVSLGGSVYSTPTGLTNQPDRDKLMRNQPTGALIAVIGDDNDDFIFVGSSREFIAQRDGRLFLGVNEGNLADNSGAYDVTIEAEAVAGNNQ